MAEGTSSIDLNQVGVLVRREIEARIIAPLIEAFSQELGREKTIAIAAEVIHDLSREQGRQLATKAGGNGIAEFVNNKGAWKKGNALATEVLRAGLRHAARDGSWTRISLETRLTPSTAAASASASRLASDPWTAPLIVTTPREASTPIPRDRVRALKSSAARTRAARASSAARWSDCGVEEKWGCWEAQTISSVADASSQRSVLMVRS